MDASPQSTHAERAAALRRLVVSTRQRLWILQLLAGSAAMLCLTLAWFFCAAIVDLWMPLSIALRLAAFSLGISLFFVYFGFAILRPALRPKSIAHVASRIEATIPDMHNRLITVLELQPDASSSTSPFARTLIDQTHDRLASFKPSHIASPRAFHRNALALSAAILLTVVTTASIGNPLTNAWSRILAPTADIAPITHTAYRAEPGDVHVLRGDPLELSAIIERGEVDSLHLQLRAVDDDATWHTYPMSRAGGNRFTFTITAMDRSYDYRITGGRTWSAIHHIHVVQRPVIESIAATIERPAYMATPVPEAVENLSRIAAPLGGALHFTIKAQGEIVHANLEQREPVSSHASLASSSDTLWFDDELPDDAQIIGRWRWLTKPTLFGLKSHTFSTPDQAYGFRSRLRPLALNTGEVFFVHAHVDPLNPPGRISITLGDDNFGCVLTWDDESQTPAHAAESESIRRIHMGPVPKLQAREKVAGRQAAHWARLEVPFETMRSSEAVQSMRFNAILFESQGGRVVFDGVGKSAQPRTAASTPRERPIHHWPLLRDEHGQWRGSMPVLDNASITIELTDVHGHRNRSMVPTTLIALPDLPPAVLIEKPDRAAVLTEVSPVLLRAAISDDFGLAATAVQVSRDPDSFSQSSPNFTPLAQPVTTHTLITTLDPIDEQGRALKPGEAFYARIVAQDRKGQQTASQPIRIAFMSEPALPKLSASQRSEELSQLLRQLREITAKQAELTDLTDRLLAGLPDDVHQKPNAEQEQLLRQLHEQLAAVQLALSQAASQLDAQARAAGAADASLEQQVLRELAAQTRALSEQPRDSAATERTLLERLRDLRTQAPTQHAALNQLQHHMTALQQAREQLNTTPREAARALDDLLAQLKAIGAARQLNQLAQSLQDRQRQLAALEEQQKTLSKQNKTNDKAESLEAMHRDQQSLDHKALQAIKQAQQLLKPEPRKDNPRPAWDAQDSSREALQAHQQQREKELSDARQGLANAREQAMQMATTLQQTAQQMEAHREDSSAAAQSLRSLLDSASTKSMLSMASRMRRQAREHAESQLASDRVDPTTPGQAQGEQNQPQFRRGQAAPTSLDPIDPRLPNAFYRLPPHLRAALQQGRDDKGPKPYQPLIDAYHRHLTDSAQERSK